MKVFEDNYESIMIFNGVIAAFVVGIEFTKELRNNQKTTFLVNSDKGTFAIIMLITIFAFLWIQYGDDFIEKYISKDPVTFTAISVTLGWLVFQFTKLVRFI